MATTIAQEGTITVDRDGNVTISGFTTQSDDGVIDFNALIEEAYRRIALALERRSESAGTAE